MEWELRIVSFDLATTYGSFTSEDNLATDDPRLALQLREVLNDTGVGKLSLPLGDAANDWMVEQRFALLFIRDSFVSAFLFGAADDNPVSQQEAAGQVATYNLTHANDLLNKALIYPSRGMNVLPPGDDRIFDSSDPAYDASAWDTPDELMTVTDAQTGWELTPFANGFGGTTASSADVAGDDAYVIGPPGFSATPDPPPAPGTYYYRVDATVVGGWYRGFTCGDDGHGPVRIDGVNVVSQLVTQFGTAQQFDIELSAGTHTFWATVVQSEDPDNPGQGLGPTGFAFALCPRGQNDEMGTPEVVSDSSWKIWTDVSTTPGFTPGGIGALALFEAVARGCSIPLGDYDATDDSAGNAWAGVTIRSTKAGTSTLQTLFCKEMGSDTIDTVVTVVSGALKWRLWPFNGRGATQDVTLEAGVNIHSLTINREPIAMTTGVARIVDRFLDFSTDPGSGLRVEAGLSLGASQTAEEATTIAAQQLNDFNHTREKISLVHITGPQTPDEEMPGLAYWVGDSITIPVDRDLTPGVERVIAMTVELQGSGQLQFTPEFGDLIVPKDARPAQALAKMAPGLRARAVTPPTTL